MNDWQILSLQVAIFTGIITAILALIQAFLSLREKKKKFTFERLKMARELIDDIYEPENKAPKALLMIDERKVEYKSSNKVVDTEEIIDALSKKEVINDKCDFIRDCFDELFFYMERIEHSIDSNLIKFEDIEPHFSYYVRERINNNKNLYIGYAEHIHYSGVTKFINRFK